MTGDKRLFACHSSLIARHSFDLAALLIPAAGYFAIALTTDINLGYRHLLATLPFLYVLIGVVTADAFARGGAGRVWVVRARRAAPVVSARVISAVEEGSPTKWMTCGRCWSNGPT